MGNNLTVVAVGGNSLIKDREHESIPDQFLAAAETAEHIVDMIEAGRDIVVTHGNGPQVGFILRRSELSIKEIPPVPMDYAGADIQGAVGYMFQRAIRNALRTRGIERQVATVVTQTLVDPDDSAFDDPQKPIGSQMDKETAEARSTEQGWTIREDSGRGYRRVVASPEPKGIIELEAIHALAAAGHLVICCGGGGIPVVRDANGLLRGVEAVIDKDLASSVLADEMDAEMLVISTGVERVALGFGTPNEKWLDSCTRNEALRYLSEGHFHKGSMEPKVRAVVRFIEKPNRTAIVTNPENLGRALKGETGTRFS